MRGRTLAILIVFLAISGRGATVGAQAPVLDPSHPRDRFRYDGPVLTLEAALLEAREKHPDLVALRAGVSVTRERPAQARALPPPMLEATAWQWPINSINPANTSMYMLMATQELPRSEKRALLAAVADADVAIAGNEVTVREKGVIESVTQAYLELLLARRAIAIHLDAVDLLRQIADAAQIRYETGRAPQQEVLTPVVEVSRLHADLIELDQQSRMAEARLNTWLDRPIDAPIGSLSDIPERTLAASIPDLQQTAVAHHPELQGGQLAIQRAQAELLSARVERKPEYSVQAGYMVVPRQTDGVLARLAVTWPNAPWARRGIDARVREASASIDAARARDRALGSSTRLAIQEAYLRAKAAEERRSLIRTTIIPQAQQALDVSRVGYQTDRGDLTALLDNERVLLEAQLDYDRARADFNQAIAALERAVGTSLTDAQLPVAPRER